MCIRIIHNYMGERNSIVNNLINKLTLRQIAINFNRCVHSISNIDIDTPQIVSILFTVLMDCGKDYYIIVFDCAL